MLAVIQDQQSRFGMQIVCERVEERAIRVFPQLQDGSDGLRHQCLLGQRGEIHKPDAIGKFRHFRFGDSQRQTSLAHAAAARQRHQPRRRQPIRDFLNGFLTAYE